MTTRLEINVLGAGVTGLTTAVLLQAQGHSVTIITKSSPEDSYSKDILAASPKAGANWQSFADADDVRQQNWDEQTFHVLWRLAHQSACGIMHLPAYQYFHSMPDADFEHPWFARITPGYAAITDPQQLPPGVKFGITFETVTINVPKYLNWLLAKFRAAGGKIVMKEVLHINEVLEYGKRTDVVVNCCGIGALTLGGIVDHNVYPTRGQTILVKAPQVRRTIGTALASGSYRPKGTVLEDDGTVTYVIPREDGLVILGGTYQQGNSIMEADAKTAEGILQRCIRVCPELAANGKPEIVYHGVGLRPGRVGGVRLDAQYEKTPSGREVLLINNYGHGGFGYQSSYGCSARVVEIVRRAFGMPFDERVLSRFVESALMEPKSKL